MLEVDLITFAINLKKRTDRHDHVVKQFSKKTEFQLHMVEALPGRTGSEGLWKTIKQIITKSLSLKLKFLIICEDDHYFTEKYSKNLLIQCIKDSEVRNADMLLGGVSWFNNAVQVNENLFMVQKFSGLQFTVIFNRFFDKILNSDFTEYDTTDYKLASLTENKYFIYPFISQQAEFGYSDVSGKNNIKGWVTELFRRTVDKVETLKRLAKIFKSFPYKEIDLDYDGFSLPIFILKSNIEPHLNDVESQFLDKSEFEVKTIDIDSNIKISWETIRKIVRWAQKNDEDFVILCSQLHTFTKDYSKKFLINNIISADDQGVECLFGGTNNLSFAIQSDRNRLWLNKCATLQFVIIFKRMYKHILYTDNNINILPEIMLSNLAKNKQIIFPFISNMIDSDLSKPSQDVCNLEQEIASRLSRIIDAGKEWQ